MKIRTVADRDMAAIHAIYRDAVLHGVSSWEEVPPSIAELTRRRDAILSGGFPYLVAEQNDAVLGYAYASPYRPRSAYRYTVENTIYLAKEARGKGLGRLLLEALITACQAKGYKQMIAVIGDSENEVSIGFHARMGFERVGLIRNIGFKFDRWMDQVIMQKGLG